MQGFPSPVIIVIDRAGKIAYRSDIAAGDHNLKRFIQENRPGSGKSDGAAAQRAG